jgi:hypothetical protein
MSGFYAMHRGWQDADIFGNADYSERDAWVWLIEQASWKPTTVRIKGDKVELQRGQMTFSVRFLAEKWGWSKSRVDRFLKRLTAEAMISTCSKIGTTAGHQAGHGQSIITICNYEKYQSPENAERDNDETQIGTTAGQQRDKEEEGNKGIRNNPSVAKATSGARAPDPFPRPDFADAQVWKDFLANRRKKRLVNSETAYKGFLEDIARHADGEWPPGRLLRHAAAKGWGGIYDPREQENRNGTPNHNRPQDEPRDGVVRAYARREAERAAGPPGGLSGYAGDWPEQRGEVARLR